MELTHDSLDYEGGVTTTLARPNTQLAPSGK
jgi:hypothetical protein